MLVSERPHATAFIFPLSRFVGRCGFSFGHERSFVDGEVTFRVGQRTLRLQNETASHDRQCARALPHDCALPAASDGARPVLCGRQKSYHSHVSARADRRLEIFHFPDLSSPDRREADPGRLVFSDRFMLGEREDVLENVDLYSGFDGLAVNIYPANTTPGLDPAERQFLDLLYAKSNKPIIIGECPHSIPDITTTRRSLTWSYPQTVETQTQRARQSAQFLADLPIPQRAALTAGSTTRAANRGPNCTTPCARSTKLSQYIEQLNQG